HERWQEFAANHQALIESVRTELRARGPLGHRDFEETARVNSYRARKESGLALYYLWRGGELMTAGRRGFDRLEGFAGDVAAAEYLNPASEADAEAYFIRKAVKMSGITRLTPWRTTFDYFLRRTTTPDEMKDRIATLVEAGEVTPVKIEGMKDIHYLF